MPEFAANLSMLFAEHDLPDRPAAAAANGFRWVEVQFPYELDADVWRDALTENALSIALFNLPAGDLITGGPGLSGVPGREADFDTALDRACRYAEALKPPCINTLPGLLADDVEREAALETLAVNLEKSASRLADIGVTAVFEPVNRQDRPGTLIATMAEALELMARVDHPNLFIQFDIYHMTIMEPDAIAVFRENVDAIRHVQFADVPGRGEPGTGTIDFAAMFAAIDAMSYAGRVAAEYVPSGPTPNTLGWMV